MSAASTSEINVGSAVLIPVLENQRFDEAALLRYLAPRLPEFRDGCTVQQFQGGFSNPTFHLQTRTGAFVLRKKPPGTLLPSAHAVDREYEVLRALAASGVPVPRARLLCEDPDVIGTIWYLMDYVEGRVFGDRLLHGVTPVERRAMYDDMNRVLARLHGLDYVALGLANFGRPTGYVSRQVVRWSKQYRASAVESCPAMERLIEWLPAHLPLSDEAAIAHGDYRIGNLLFAPREPRVVAVLDWELSTIGHPLADLAYCCLAYHLPEESGRGLLDCDLTELGIPSEAEFLASYAERTGRGELPEYHFFVVFSLFRLAAILAGAYKRAIDGQAVDERMSEASRDYQKIAARAEELAFGGRELKP